MKSAIFGIISVVALLTSIGVASQLTDSAEAQTVYDAQCRQDNALHITEDGATYRNITVKNSRAAAILVEADNVTLDNVTVENWNCAGQVNQQFAAGISCPYCSKLTVTNSRLTTTREWGNGIWFKSTSSRPTTGDHYIAHNVISGGYDGIGSETESDVHGGMHDNTIIEHNTISNCADDGIQVEGRNENITVRFNNVSRCLIGIAFAPNLVGPLKIEDNVMSNLTSACFKIGNSANGIAYVTRNTCQTQGDGFKQTNSGLNPIVSRENCIQVSRYVIEFSSNAPSGTSFDYDRLYTTDPSRFVKWNNQLYSSINSFRSATGQERNGVQAQGCGVAPTATPTNTPTIAPSTPTPIPPSNTPVVTPPNCTVRVGRNNVDGTLQAFNNGRVCVIP